MHYLMRAEQEDQMRREDNRREARAMLEHAMRTAKEWPESLHKQARLCQREATLWRYDWMHAPADDDYFGDIARACRRALQIWDAEAPSVADKIADLERQIARLQFDLRRQVADRLSSEIQYQSHGWRHVVETLADPGADPSEWLDW